MGLDNFDRPMPDNGLGSYSLEALREELNSLDRGLSELTERRRAIMTEINIRIDDTRMHLGSSEEHFAKATGQYEGTERAEPMPIDIEKSTGRRGW